jgi:glycosyltransferase involved in cell wall biosynthesis
MARNDRLGWRVIYRQLRPEQHPLLTTPPPYRYSRKPYPMTQTYDWEIPNFEAAVYEPKKHEHALVIPVINEGMRIQEQLRRIREAALPVDVIIADGGSKDGSLEDVFLTEVGVRARLTKVGPGKLSAQLRMAYAWALEQDYSGIVTIDGNGKDGVDAVRTMVDRLEKGYDYVQGSRYRAGGQAENTPLERTIGNRFIHAPMLSLAGRRWFTDTTNGFRAYSSTYLLDPMVAPFRSVFMNYELLFYLTVRAGQLGYKVTEVPVRRSYPRGEGVPTKITGASAKAALFKQTLDAARGCFKPEETR